MSESRHGELVPDRSLTDRDSTVTVTLADAF